ncbi:hypothetical protein DRH27_01500 [Candidatus Falkowbacteria bacterium]|nr:MAG: hypothetical protein DRH27_01500 [Candidatus Falkowbacteria bacterium]
MFRKIFKRKEVNIVIVLVALFILASFLSNKYSGVLGDIALINGLAGKLTYASIVAIGVLFAAVSTLPLLPVAVSLWGPNLAAIYTIIGWSGGSLLAFFIARRFGQKLVCKFIDKCDIDEYRKDLPKKNLFWLLILARVVLPVDIISYAIGLFTKMHWGPFLVATIIGTSIFSFIFAYGSELPVIAQFIVGVLLLTLFIFKYKKIKLYIRKFIKIYKKW